VFYASELKRNGSVATMLAIDILAWPGMNQAFLFSLVLTFGLIGAGIEYGKRRPVDQKATWGEAMFGGMYAFAVMFLAYGVVPHQWIDHADKDLGWRKDKILFGPGDILKPKALGGNFPVTLSYEALRDIIVVVIYVIFVGAAAFCFSWWQKRGEKTEKAPTSTYGRPLVKKA
jgi:hypothetical protein